MSHNYSRRQFGIISPILITTMIVLNLGYYASFLLKGTGQRLLLSCFIIFMPSRTFFFHSSELLKNFSNCDCNSEKETFIKLWGGYSCEKQFFFVTLKLKSVF